MDKKILLHSVDALFLVGSLLFVMFLVGYMQPLFIAPLSNNSLEEKEVLFSIGNGRSILIDQDIEFNSLRNITLFDGLIINLSRGIYYLTVEGFEGGWSDIKTLTLLSEINIRFVESSEGYDVVNAGKTNLNVQVLNSSNQVDSFKVSSEELESQKTNKFLVWFKDE